MKKQRILILLCHHISHGIRQTEGKNFVVKIISLLPNLCFFSCVGKTILFQELEVH